MEDRERGRGGSRGGASPELKGGRKITGRVSLGKSVWTNKDKNSLEVLVLAFADLVLLLLQIPKIQSLNLS